MTSSRPSRARVAGGRAAPRRYDSSRRVAAVAVTRREIVDAVIVLLDESEVSRLTLDDVAAAVGVSRPTIYNHFGSRRGLLVAVMEELGRLIEYRRVQEAQRIADPAKALLETIREACRCWASSQAAIRRILALGVLDPEISQLNAKFEGYRRAELGALASRIAAAGLLGRAVTLADAEVTMGAMTGPQAFALFGGDREPEQACKRLTRTILAALGIHPPSE